MNTKIAFIIFENEKNLKKKRIKIDEEDILIELNLSN